MWSKEESELLSQIFPFETWDNILLLFENYTKEQIRHKAGRMGLKRNFVENCGGRGVNAKEYTEEEIRFISENYYKTTIKEIAHHLGRGESSVSNKISYMGLKKVENWSDKDISILKKKYPFFENTYIQRKYLPNKSLSAISKKAKKLNLAKSINKLKSKKKITKEYATSKLLDLSNFLGRTPIHSELVANGLPSLATYRLLFGNYTNACLEAGLTPNFSKVGLGRKSVLFSKNLDICYSIYEQIITNFFIDNYIWYKKEERYSSYINDKRCKTKRVDWVLPDGTFVEYWGFPNDERYARQMNLKIKICKDNKVNLISLFISDVNRLERFFEKYINLYP